MEQLLKTLFEIGLSAEEVRRIEERYQGDINGLRFYVCYMRAILDDRHEFVD